MNQDQRSSITPASPLLVSEIPFPHADVVQGISALLQEAFVEEAFLVGNADDGQIWGKWHESRLYTASQEVGVGASLQNTTLLWLRVCTPTCELRIWPRGGQFEAAWAKEGEENPSWMTLDRTYPLIGSHLPSRPAKLGGPEPRNSQDGKVVFTVLRGRAGECHAPPLAWTGGKLYPQLAARLYYHRKQFGTWQLTGTRWLALEIKDDNS